MNTLSAVLIGLGLLLDGLNLVWAWQSRRGASKSSIVILPLVPYALGILSLDSALAFRDRLWLGGAALLVHIICSQLVPRCFDRMPKGPA